MGRRRLRRDLRVDEPGRRRADRGLPEIGPGGRRPRGGRREGGVRGLATRAGAEARRAALPVRAAHGRAQGRGDRSHDPRDGEGLARGRRRRPGSDRHELLHGRRGPAPLRADDSVRAPGQVQHVGTDADRRRRRDHAVELPDRHSLLEDRARARRGEHGRVQACDRHAGARAALRRAARRGRHPQGRREHRPRRRRRGGRSPGPPSRRAGDHADGLAGHGSHGDAKRGRRAQADPPRARRQERDHRPR